MHSKADRRILLVFPHDFTELKTGIHKYIYELVESLNSSGYIIDQVGINNFESSWQGNRPQKDGLVDKLFLYDRKSANNFAKRARGNQFRYYLYMIMRFGVQSLPDAYKIRGFFSSVEIPQMVDYKMIRDFREISKEYDYIVYGYAYWWILEKFKSSGAVSVLSQSDFLSSQQIDKGNLEGQFTQIASECSCINDFDIVLSISEEEMYLFRQIARSPTYYYLPVFIQKHGIGVIKKDIDILYVAYDNPHNRKALNWIIDELYKKIKIMKARLVVIGKISKAINSAKYPGIELVEYADDLDMYYRRSKIAIAPMLSGSGMKIKVVEALTYGLPVVTTEWGVIGLLNKRDNGCIIEETATGFVDSAIGLLSDVSLYEKTAQRALEYSEAYHSPEIFRRKISAIFK